MKFSTILATASALIASVNAAPVERSEDPIPIQHLNVTVEYYDDSLNGSGLVGKHEGAGIDYIFFGGEGGELLYNSTSGILTDPESNYPFGVQDRQALFSVTAETPVSIDNGYISIDGIDYGFAACKNLNDPYKYTESEYALTSWGKETPSSSCLSIKLKVESAWAVL